MYKLHNNHKSKGKKRTGFLKNLKQKKNIYIYRQNKHQNYVNNGFIGESRKVTYFFFYYF